MRGHGNFHHLVAMHIPAGLHVLQPLAQAGSAMAALLWKYGVDFVDAFGRRLRAMIGPVWPPGFLTLGLRAVLRPLHPGFPSHAVRRRGLRGIRGILLSRRQLPFQVGDLLGGLPGFVVKLFIFALQTLDFAEQGFRSAPWGFTVRCSARVTQTIIFTNVLLFVQKLFASP